MEFYIKLITTLTVTYLIYRYMAILQKEKEERAEKEFQRTLKRIEERNKKI